MTLLRQIAATLALGLASIASAGVTQYDHCPAPGAATSDWGTGAKEVYDVAMKVSDPSLAGKTINSVSIPFPASHVQGCKVWLSSELSLVKDEQSGKKVNDPDIASIDAARVDGHMVAVFSEPVDIPEAGIWVGYTFEITDKETASDQHPVTVYSDTPEQPGLWVHTSKRYMKWTDLNAVNGCCSAMEVTIGGIPQTAAGIFEIEKTYASSDSPTQLPILIANHGDDEIASIEYTYNVASESGSQAVQFSTPLPARFSMPVPLTVSLPMIAQTGDYKGTLEITKVNGNPNADSSPSREFTLAVIGFIPKTRPLMEEYTGLWCGYCPRGFACLEHMNDLYGDDFIGVSYHSGDPMEIPHGVPESVHSFPEAHLNRSLVQDPDFAEINPVWEGLCREFSIADITPRAWWTDESHSQIYAEATTRFVSGEDDADYKVAYVLVQNGMSDPKWLQTNNYAGDPAYKNDPYMDVFTNGQKQVQGLVFNDVAIYSPQPDGEPGSVPAQFDASQEMTHSLTINAADVVNIYHQPLIQHPESLFLVTILLDKAGKVVNAARCPVAIEPASVLSIESDTAQAAYYDLSGRRVANPCNGIFIKVLNGKAVKIRL